MYNNECNKIITCNSDKYIEVKYINDFIIFDSDPNEDYITINKVDELFTHNNVNKNTFVNSGFHENNSMIPNINLEKKDEEICSPQLICKNDNKGNPLLEQNIGSDLSEDEDNEEDEEDIDNQITEYKEELVMIETEISILNNIIFNMIVSNKKSIFNLHRLKMRIFNKKNCDTLMSKIKILSERKKIIETTIHDIYKLMKTYEK